MSSTSNNLDTVEQRLAHADEVPASAKRLVKLATEHGWDSETYFSRGTRLAAKKASDNLTVRMTKDARRLVGVWVNQAFNTGLVGVQGQQLMVTLSSKALTTAVRDAV